MKDAAPALTLPPGPGWPRVFLLTARGREATLRATLAAWARTDWPGATAGADVETPRVVVDPAPGGDPQGVAGAQRQPPFRAPRHCETEFLPHERPSLARFRHLSFYPSARRFFLRSLSSNPS